MEAVCELCQESPVRKSARHNFRHWQDGAASTFQVIGSVQVGNPTGGDKGAGTINAGAVYDDNVLLTDYVFDKYFDGHVREEDQKRHGNYRMLTLEEMAGFIEQERHLPTMIGRKEWEKEGASLGTIVTQLWETVETQALYIKELREMMREQGEEIERLKGGRGG